MIDVHATATWPLLHGGVTAGDAAAFEWWAVALSVVIVGGIGGVLYWYYGRRIDGR